MPDSITRTAEENAAEFAALSKQGKDLRLALLAACSVRKGAGQGTPPSNRREAKISAGAFARRAGTTDTRVARHLEAWDKFAAKAKLPKAAKLNPADAAKPDLISPEQTEMWDDIQLTDKRYVENKPTPMAKRLNAMPEHELDAFAQDLDPAVAAALVERITEDNEPVAVDVAAKVMKRPSSARKIVEDPEAVRGMTQARVEHEAAKTRTRPQAPAVPHTPRPASAETGAALEFGLVLDEWRLCLNRITEMLPHLSNEEVDILIDFVDTEEKDIISMWRSMPSFSGHHDFTPEDIIGS